MLMPDDQLHRIKFASLLHYQILRKTLMFQIYNAFQKVAI